MIRVEPGTELVLRFDVKQSPRKKNSGFVPYFKYYATLLVTLLFALVVVLDLTEQNKNGKFDPSMIGMFLAFLAYHLMAMNSLSVYKKTKLLKPRNSKDSTLKIGENAIKIDYLLLDQYTQSYLDDEEKNSLSIKWKIIASIYLGMQKDGKKNDPEVLEFFYNEDPKSDPKYAEDQSSWILRSIIKDHENEILNALYSNAECPIYVDGEKVEYETIK